MPSAIGIKQDGNFLTELVVWGFTLMGVVRIFEKILFIQNLAEMYDYSSGKVA